MAVDLLKHNEESYKKIVEVLKTDNRTCVIQPTGSGKSFLILKLIEDYMVYGRDIIIIEPQKYIFEQLQKKMKKYELPVENVKFVTYSALGKVDDEKLQEYNSPSIVMVDEMHRAGAKTWESGLQKMFDLFPDDCKYVGFSATPIRFLDGKRDMCKELFNGCVANEIGLADAILNRILPLPRYMAGLYSYNSEFNAINKKILQSYNSEEEKKELLEEVKILKNNLDKSNGISDIFKKYIEGDKGKYIAFCRNIAHLNLMKPCLEKWFSDAGIDVNLYEVHCKNPEKDKQFAAFMEDDGLSVCLSVGMLSEGVHGIDGVILLRDLMSPNLYYQQLGRCFSVDMKTVPIIFDLVANCESILNCSLKNDLLDVIDKRDRENKDSEDDEGEEKGEGSDRNKITRKDIEKFFVFDQVVDSVRAFREIENKLVNGWENGLKHFDKYMNEHDGDVLVPVKYKDKDDGFYTGSWSNDNRTNFRKGILSADKIAELEKRNFVWDVNEYKFKNYLKALKQYMKNTGNCNIPYNHIETLEDGRKINLGSFVFEIRKREKSSYILTDERISWLNALNFKWDTENCVDRFYRYAILYKERYGDFENLSVNDEFEGYKIGMIYNVLRKKYKDGKISEEDINKLKRIGIDISKNRYDKQFETKMNLAKQAFKEKVIITQKNNKYKGVDLYSWYRTNKDKFTSEELDIVNSIVPDRLRKTIRIFDKKNNATYIYSSVTEAGKALCNEFHFVNTEKTGINVIYNRLSGHAKNSIYKNRFRFECAD